MSKSTSTTISPNRVKWFTTFGGPTYHYHCRADFVCKQMERLDDTFRTKAWKDMDLFVDADFVEKHGAFLQDPHNERGYGYWIWKPYLIRRMMHEMLEMNDILLYADAGCTCNGDGYMRLQEYVRILDENPFGMLVFQLPMHLHEICYTKRKVLEETFHATMDEMRSPQCMATVVMMRKTPYTMQFVDEWYRLASCHDLINDDHCTMERDGKVEYKKFVDHRHDQSIYSMLVKQYLRHTDTDTDTNTNTNTNTNTEKPMPLVIPDETFFYPSWYNGGRSYPIWATRIRKV